MTKKDYVAIARVIATRIPDHDIGSDARLALVGLARDLVDIMQSDNPRFDRARFLAACGVQS